MHIATPKIEAIAWTHFEPPADVPWQTDADGGQALAEFAGRACYQSWRKPNPATATNEGYLRHILDVGHLSVLEHGTVTFYMTGVSRSFTHELVRHRHFSYSQLSQRYVPGRSGMAVPEVIAEDKYLLQVFTDAADASLKAYKELLHALGRKFAADEPVCPKCGGPLRQEANPASPAEAAEAAGWWCWTTCLEYRTPTDPPPSRASETLRRKQARQAARAVLPNAAETRIVVTGNYRAWRHFVSMRASAGADVEIRAVAVAVLRELQLVAPSVFGDFTIVRLDDGTEVAATPYSYES